MVDRCERLALPAIERAAGQETHSWGCGGLVPPFWKAWLAVQRENVVGFGLWGSSSGLRCRCDEVGGES
jgi:hypothetical protein